VRTRDGTVGLKFPNENKEEKKMGGNHLWRGKEFSWFREEIILKNECKEKNQRAQNTKPNGPRTAGRGMTRLLSSCVEGHEKRSAGIGN